MAESTRRDADNSTRDHSYDEHRSRERNNERTWRSSSQGRNEQSATNADGTEESSTVVKRKQHSASENSTRCRHLTNDLNVPRQGQEDEHILADDDRQERLDVENFQYASSCLRREQDETAIREAEEIARRMAQEMEWWLNGC